MHLQSFGNRRVVLLAAVLLTAVLLLPRQATAISPEDADVKRHVQSALGYLASSRDASLETRLGGVCLIGLCFKKAEIDDHPRITQAIDLCYKTGIKDENVIDNYSLGIALMYLCEIDPVKHHDLIVSYTDEMLRRQKPNGAWGYGNYKTGDTSQTQYAILGLWMAKKRAKIDIPVDRMEAVCGWLMRTQDPSGGWGYQGIDPGTFNRVAQTPPIGRTLTASGAGQLYMIADLLQVTPQKDVPVGPNKSKVLQDVEVPGKKKAILGPLTVTLNPADIKNTMAAADRYLGNSFAPDDSGAVPWNHYYLYALERYHSFRENAGGAKDDKWYEQGYAYLAKEHKADGSWEGRDTAPIATCFATLFLLRSAKKAIEKKLSEGVAIGGSGLPPDVKDLQVTSTGTVVKVGTVLPTDQILELIQAGANDEVTRKAEEKEALELSKNPTDRNRQIEMLRKSVGVGDYHARKVVVITLSKVRNLDNVPRLLYALTDPDPRIVLEADKGLRFISRKVDGVGLPEGDLTTDQIKSAQVAWKAWYLSIRPNAELLD